MKLNQSITNVFFLPERIYEYIRPESYWANECLNVFGVFKFCRMNVQIYSRLLKYVQWIFEYISKKYPTTYSLLIAIMSFFYRRCWLVMLKTFRLNQTEQFWIYDIYDENCQFQFFFSFIILYFMIKWKWMWILCDIIFAHDICLLNIFF